MATNIPSSSLPTRPAFGTTLESLGYFLTKEGLIRKISNPDEGFKFDVTKDERIAKMEAHALQQAVCGLVLHHLSAMRMHVIPIPVQGNAEAVPHTLITASQNLKTAKRIIVLCGDEGEDMGIFSYLDAIEHSLRFGTILGMVSGICNGEDIADDDVALIVLNPAQYIWNPQTKLAESLETFRLREASSLISPVRDPTRRNEIQGNRTLHEHVEYVFENILMPCMRGNTKIDILGVADGGVTVHKFLKENWTFWHPFISNMQLIDPRHVFDESTIATLYNPSSFASFMRDRSRAWVRSDLPLGSHEIGIGARGCNCYAGGETAHINAILPRCLDKALAWMKLMHGNPALKETPCLVEGEANMLERADRNGPPADHDWAGSFVLSNLLRLSWCGPPEKLESKYARELVLLGRRYDNSYDCTPVKHINATMDRLFFFLEGLVGDERRGAGGGDVAQ
ncbi:hypothetical protein PENANT_c009G03611 [Penicillium antarcticum]|uniref:Arb2 domain-containing protein n=1 Tax=Penicillium antarcticum TaxID=416450 RepID=A0A1V6Q992_9EURO|nr:uncharacterized protein N7508_008932 [Penicillium antarcticum]KAJ5294111.1 hypothetical protein N7508_008932 [Penicillium antarcticum]OQD85800.1 hypothetical protein PENANT_c009G03611 [Penicillium antarcticum]